MKSRFYSKNPKDNTKVKNIYILRTHLLDNYVKDTYQKMQDQLGSENVFLLFDETNGPPAASSIKWNSAEGVSAGPAIITVNEADCQKINALHNEGEFSGSKHKVEGQIYACYKAIKGDYDYMWFIEYDVFCNNFHSALRPFDDVAADMLTKGSSSNYQKWIRTYLLNRKWFWWSGLEGEISRVSIFKRRGCFFPINRFSKRFLQVMEQNLSKSSGYSEVYFPTLCHVNGLVLKSLPLNLFSDFRYQPNITVKEIKNVKKEDNRLYHPVKNL